eukprot:572653-Karenia_brevis.AAC.1
MNSAEMTLEQFIADVAYPAKDTSWDAWLLGELNKNDVKVRISPCRILNVACMSRCQTVACLGHVKFADIQFTLGSPGKRGFAEFVFGQWRKFFSEDE